MDRYCHICGRSTDYNFHCPVCSPPRNTSKRYFDLYYRVAIVKKSVEAFYRLGECFDLGIGVESNDEKAICLYKHAAKQGHPTAMYCLSNLYYFRDEDEMSVKWLQKAAEHGQANAQNKIAEYFLYGNYDFKKDEEEAVKWFRKAAEQQLAAAQYNLGHCYNNGYGVEKNEDEAFKWFHLAAERGDKAAKDFLLIFYFEICKDYEEAFKWVTMFAERDNPDTPFNVGVYGYNLYLSIKHASAKFDSARKNYLEAKKKFDEEKTQDDDGNQKELQNLKDIYSSALNNYLLAMDKQWKTRKNDEIESCVNNLKEAKSELESALQALDDFVKKETKKDSTCYHNKPILLSKIFEFCFESYSKAKKNQMMGRMFSRLGTFLDFGRAVEQDYDITDLEEFVKKETEIDSICYHKVFSLLKNNIMSCVDKYKKAKEIQLFGKVLYRLGELFFYGEAVEQDYTVAVYWFRQSARYGFAAAQHSLGICYENGQGVPQDKDEAIKWYLKAAKQPYVASIQALQNLGYDVSKFGSLMHDFMSDSWTFV